MSWKRPLYLFHRWAGIVLCAFFALWFISGVFMMYVGYPQLTRPERIAGSSDLDFSTATLTASAAASKLRPDSFGTSATPNTFGRLPGAEATASVRAIRLGMVLSRPAYIFHPDNGAQPRVVFADSGNLADRFNQSQGIAVARTFATLGGLDAGQLRFEQQVLTDQWTLSSALNDHRPLLKYSLEDDAGTVLYVSSTTGEVVRDTHRTERSLNWFGAVTHWLYFTFVRQYPEVWEWMVDILSVAGTLLAISGLWIGVLRWKRNPKPGKSSVPYKGIMRWHYFTGIIFGVVTITWVFSGLMSMNPLDLNPPRRATPEQALVYSGTSLSPAAFPLTTPTFAPGVVEAELVHYDGQPFYKVLSRDLRTDLASATGDEARRPDAITMIREAARLLPDAAISDAALLTSFDNYYYTRHPERGDKPLPIVRVRFDDEQETWFHLDPVTGQILERSTHTNRVYRWLYNGLHSWDILWLWERRPLWDICVIAFSLGGTLLSILGVVIGVKRLRFKYGEAPGRAARNAHIGANIAADAS